MGAAFDRWLAKPGTLHFLRRLVASDAILPSAQATIITTCNSRRYIRAYAARTRGIRVVQKLKSSEISRTAVEEDKSAGPSEAFAQLAFQSDVNNIAKLGKLLADESEHRENSKVWAEILQFRHRVNGFEGVSDVWRGMRMRNVDLPVEGPEADLMWPTFIYACMKDRERAKHTQLLWEIFEYAKDLMARDGVHYLELYKCIIARCFRVRVQDAVVWHDRLLLAGLASPEDVASVAIYAHRAHAPENAFRAWAQMHRAGGESHLYDKAVGEVLKLGDKGVAVRWHNWLIRQGYAPSTEMSATPDVQELFDIDRKRSLSMIRREESQNSEPPTHKDTWKGKVPPFTRESMNTIVGDVHGIHPKQISDSFCARLVATRAFSLDLVVRGLSFLGIELLGPLTLRELALRAASRIELLDKLADLKKLSISPRHSVFAQLVLKAAHDVDSRRWDALLESDQHPEVYEEAATQEALLVSFLEQQKLAQAHVALAALSLTHPNAHRRGWNRVLQHYVVHRNHRSVLTTIRKIQEQDLSFTLHSLTLLRRHLLPERRPGKRPFRHQKVQDINTLSLLKRACLHTARKGHFVPVNMWVELLKRYGMTHQWESTKNLVLWLFDHYCLPRSSEEQTSLVYRYLGEKLVQQRALKLRLIFTPVMLQALFIWGFRSAENLDPPGADDTKGHCESWARGLALLHHLHQRKLFDTLTEARTAFQQRMWILFSPGYSTIGMNNHARLMNRISLIHYINHANKIWDGFIDWVDPALLQETGRSDPQLLVQFYGSLYRTSLKTSEYANVEEWAKTLGKMEQSHYAQPLSVREKKQAWNYSPFRISDPVHLSKAKDLASAKQWNTEQPELSSTIGTLDINSHPPPKHQSPSARSSSSRQQPSQRYIPARP